MNLTVISGCSTTYVITGYFVRALEKRHLHDYFMKLQYVTD